MNWEKVRKAIVFIISILLVVSMYYLLYWKAKILFRF